MKEKQNETRKQNELLIDNQEGFSVFIFSIIVEKEYLEKSYKLN